MANQHRQAGHFRTKGKSREAVFARTQKKGFGRIPTRQAVFDLAPSALRNLLDLDDAQEILETEPEADMDDIVEGDTDLNSGDDDELENEAAAGEWYTNRYLSGLGKSLEFEGLPTLDLGNAYPISIAETNHQGFACNFQEPTWFQNALGTEAGPHIERLIRFMQSLSEWLETERQQFLGHPTAAFFVCTEADFPRKPVVLQKGILARVNERLQESHQLTEEDFSRLVNKVWLLWPHWCLPLRNVFCREYRMEWVVQGCLYRIRSTGSWIEKLSSNFTKHDLALAKSKDFGNLSLEETFRVLCDLGSVNFKQAFSLVASRARQLERQGNGIEK